jgi:hypothetical protein
MRGFQWKSYCIELNREESIADYLENIAFPVKVFKSSLRSEKITSCAEATYFCPQSVA